MIYIERDGSTKTGSDEMKMNRCVGRTLYGELTYRKRDGRLSLNNITPSFISSLPSYHSVARNGWFLAQVCYQHQEERWRRKKCY
jgi:hypothetical protein